jgi:hypothetical protein
LGITAVMTVTYLGRPPSIFAAFVLGIVFWNGRDLKRIMAAFITNNALLSAGKVKPSK